MFDPLVLLAPLLLLAVVSLLRFIGCDLAFPLPQALIIEYQQRAENNPDIVDGSAQVSTAPFGSPVTKGNLIVVWTFYVSTQAEVVSMTDSAGNQYRRAVGPTQGEGGDPLGGFRQELWWAQDIKAGENVVVTATFNDAFNAEKAISAHEYLNARSVDTGQVEFRADTAVDASVGDIDMTFGGMLFAACLFQSAGAADQDAGFTVRSTLKNNVAEDKRFPATTLNQAATFKNAAAQQFVAQAIQLLPKLTEGGLHFPF